MRVIDLRTEEGQAEFLAALREYGIIQHDPDEIEIVGGIEYNFEEALED